MKFSFIIKTLLVATIILFLFSLVQRSAHVDDAWLGEHAFWQSKLGYVKSELMHGITQQESHFLCHHKLLTLQGALLTKLFGFSIYILKSISLVYLLLFIVIFYYYNQRKKLLRPIEYAGVILVLLANALIFDISFVFRPEIPLMCLGFLSYCFIDQTLNSDSKIGWYALIGGLFAGLCFSTHLNGIIFAFAGFIVLVFNKKYIQSILFGVGTLITSAIYFYDFTSKYNLKFWLYQLNETPSHDRLSNLPYGLSYLMNLANEHMRFFHSPIEISLSILLIFSFIVARKHLKDHKNMILYTIILMVSLAVFSVHKTSKYMLLYLPYLSILLVLSSRYIFGLNIPKKIGIGLFVLYLLINGFYNIRLTNEKFSATENQKIVKQYIMEDPKNLQIIAPMTFIFNQITEFKSIQSELCYSELEKNDTSIYQKGFLNKAHSFNRDYIILSEYFIHKFGMDSLSDEACLAQQFEVVFRGKELMILKGCDKLYPGVKNREIANKLH